MKNSNVWPKKPTQWIDNRTLYISIPFTWDLPNVKMQLRQRSVFWDNAIVGGPAVDLMPGYFDDYSDYICAGKYFPGVLQRINPMATKTSSGCIRACPFCAVPKIEGKLFEFNDWPDLPVICDNNLLACSIVHFDKVVDRLKRHTGVDFNQGIDARLLTKYHAQRIAEIKGIKSGGVRLALDNMSNANAWDTAFDLLRSAGIAKQKISSYAIIGFDSGPSEAWNRCEWIESHGVKAFPMWFHRLDQLQINIVTKDQERLGWSHKELKNIMQWHYRHNSRYGGKP